MQQDLQTMHKLQGAEEEGGGCIDHHSELLSFADQLGSECFHHKQKLE